MASSGVCRLHGSGAELLQSGDDGPACRDAAIKARIMATCSIMEIGTCYVERTSVYGAVIVMPQVARSLEWPARLAFEAVRSFALLSLGLALQLLIIMMLNKHENVTDRFSGQMFLCDLGAGCTNDMGGAGSRCLGPAGTEIVPSRTYSFHTWSTRSYVKRSLLAVFPEDKERIDRLVDPGEYGMESYWCRWLCVFIFVIALMQEVNNIMDIAYLTYYVPTRADSWVRVEDEGGDATDGEREVGGEWKDGAARKRGRETSEEVGAWLGRAKISIAGMPALWKGVMVVFVLVPKAAIWELTAETGVCFLMETDGMQDLIVYSMALTFILTIEDMIGEILGSDLTHNMLSRCEDFIVFTRRAEGMSEEEILEELGGSHAARGISWLEAVQAALPAKLLGVAALTAALAWSYYRSHCDYAGGFHWWPRPLHLAYDTHFTILNAMLPTFFPLPVRESATWTMPSED